MTQQAFMALSPLDGRYADKVSALRPYFSEYGLIRFRVMIEIKWFIALCQSEQFETLPTLSPSAQKYLEDIIAKFSEKEALEIKAIEGTINHDVKAVEYFLKERFQQHSELASFAEFLHFGCTSEDINNLAYACMLKETRQEILLPELNALCTLLRNMAHEYAEVPMLARTHGQAATPTTVGKEFANVLARLQHQVRTLEKMHLFGKMNGATGNFNAHTVVAPQVIWPELSKHFIHSLGLEDNAYTTQIEPHDYIAELLMNLMRIHTLLIDFARDCWGYIALGYFSQTSLSHEVGSSTMPHKINPIDFENAEGNLGLANALMDHMAAKLPISRWQRDLSDSTVLRNLGVALGYGLLAYQTLTKGLQKISPHLENLSADLNAHWEVLAEPIQMVMRYHGIPEPYETLKAFTRGKPVTKMVLHTFIQQLALPPEVKDTLLALTPGLYTGEASHLAKRI